MRCRSCYQKAYAASIQASCVDCHATKTSHWYRVKESDSNAKRCYNCYQRARKTLNNISKQSERKVSRKQVSTVSTATAVIPGVFKLAGEKRKVPEKLNSISNAAGPSPVLQDLSQDYFSNEMDPLPKRVQEIALLPDEKEVELGGNSGLDSEAGFLMGWDVSSSSPSSSIEKEKLLQAIQSDF
jgi:hypothetical protein